MRLSYHPRMRGPAALLLAACGSVPGPPPCHWGSADSFYLAASSCRDVAADLAPADFPCASWAEPGRWPRSASSGRSELRAWLDSSAQVRAQPEVAGSCVAGRTLAYAPGANELAVAWTGELYEVVWSQPEGTFLVRVDEESWEPRAPVRIADPSFRLGWLAALGRRVLLRSGPGAVRLFDDQLREHGTVDPGPAGALVDGVLAGDTLAVVWGASDGGPAGALLYDLPGGLGAPRFDPPLLQDAPMAEPHVAWSGDAFVVAWWEDPGQVFGATIGPDGQLAIGRTLIVDGTAPRLAAGAGRAVLLYTVRDAPTFCYGELRAAFLNLSALVAGAPMTLGSSGRSTLSEYAVGALGPSFEATMIASTYAPTGGQVLTTCSSPMFVGLEPDGVVYSDILGRPYR